jgi:hypothetical protein
MFKILPIVLSLYAGPFNQFEALEDTAFFEVIQEIFPFDIFDPNSEIYYGTFRNLIIASDPTIFSGLIYHGLQEVYEHRYITAGPTDLYQAHVYTLQMTNGLEMPLTVDALFLESKVYEFAHRYGRVIGQMPIQFIERLVSFSVMSVQPDRICHSSRTKQWCADRRDEIVHNVLEELILHALTHNFLDWHNVHEPYRNVHDIFDQSIIYTHEGVLQREEWIRAMKQDNFYLTEYSKRFPMTEDVAESIYAYFASRWRPERFDPAFIEYIEKNMQNRFRILDQIDWILP